MRGGIFDVYDGRHGKRAAPVGFKVSMKKIYAILFAVCFSQHVSAQITLTAADIPASGDTLRHSRASPIGSGINTSITGANQTWNFSTLTPVAQVLDTYKTAAQVNPLYAFTISSSAYGYKIADSVPGFNPSTAPVQVRDIYGFFNKKPATNPNRYVAEGGAFRVNGFPTAANYSDEDEWYFFPLQYGDVDSSTYSLTQTIASLGTYKQDGRRTTTVDGWGTIVTPYTGSTPVQVLRLRSVIVGEDSAQGLGMNIGIPRRQVEYKWMALGEHYPLLWVTSDNTTGTEIITSVRYRDIRRNIVTALENTPTVQTFSLFPNPAQKVVQIVPPQGWAAYSVEVYSSTGTLVISERSVRSVAVDALAAGSYFVVLRSGAETAVARFQK